MAVALDRSVGLSWSRHRVAIECASDLTRGMTVVDRLGVNSDAINADVWGAAAGQSDGADILWTFDSARFQGYAEVRAGLMRRRAKSSRGPDLRPFSPLAGLRYSQHFLVPELAPMGRAGPFSLGEKVAARERGRMRVTREDR